MRARVEPGLVRSSLPTKAGASRLRLPGEEWEIEIRPVWEANELGEGFTPELQAKHQRLRAALDRQTGSKKTGRS